MDLASVRIITDNHDAMVTFYESVTGAGRRAPDAELFCAAIPVMHRRHRPHQQRSSSYYDEAGPGQTIVEWVVDDVDAEFCAASVPS